MGALWSWASSMLKWFLWSETAATPWHWLLWPLSIKHSEFELISPQFPKVYLGRPTQCPQATHSNALYHWKETLYILGFLLKGSPLSQPDLPIEYKNTLELSLTLFQPISFLRFHSTVVLPVNFHYCSWLRSAVSQTLQEEALKSVIPDLMSLNYWEN